QVKAERPLRSMMLRASGTGLTASLLILICLLATLSFTGCGVPSPPVPPQRPGRLSGVQPSAVQRGAEVILKWTTPQLRHGSRNLQRVDIYRMAEQRRAAPTTTTIDGFREAASIVGFIPLTSAIAGAPETYADTIDMSRSIRLNDTRFLYSVVYV